jgi:hypothetical protein
VNPDVESRRLCVQIARPFAEAYEFLHQPANFALWASGLAGSLKQVNGQWIAAAPDGDLKVRFSPRNADGVLDHWVTLPAGTDHAETEISIPLRLSAISDGCELCLTLFRLPGMTDEKFRADAEWVMRDLNAAKRLLESR